MSRGIINALQTLKRHGFDPHFALDIGAYSGDFTRTFKRIFPECKVAMFEPQAARKADLYDVCQQWLGVEAYGVLLGARSGVEVPFYEMETGSSVFQEASPYARRVRTVKTVALHDIGDLDRRPVDFIKLDVQGYELEVLRGGLKHVVSAKAVLMEASLVPINKGCPLIGEVIRWMEHENFRLFDICSDIRRHDGVLWQTDLMFVRNGSGLEPRPELTSMTWG